jgi:arylsulfatase A-like enzyme
MTSSSQLSRRNFLALTGGLTATAALSSGCWKSDSSAGKKPNVVLVFTDEMTLKHLSCYGGTIPTPNIDRLASEGVRFTKAYSAGAMCTPARLGVLTGQYPGRCSHPRFLKAFPVTEPYRIVWNNPIHSEASTIARVLSSAGYTTAYVGKDHNLGPNKPDLPTLDANLPLTDPKVEETLQQSQKAWQEAIRQQYGFDYAASVTTNMDAQYFEALKYHNIPWITKGAVDFLESQKGSEKPFFLYVAPTGVHGPHHGQSIRRDFRYTPQGYVPDVTQYAPDYEALNAKIKDWPSGKQHHYAAMQDMDHQVGVLMNKLEEIGEEENTLFVFMCDHNVEPGKTSCMERGFHIPMLMRWPRKIKAGAVSSSLVQSVDILPTLASLAGASLPEGVPFDGTDASRLFDNPKATVREYVYLESGFDRAVSDGRYKYIARRLPEKYIEKMKNGDVEYAFTGLGAPARGHSQLSATFYPGYLDQNQVYDVKKDPYEQNNLYGKPEVDQVTSRLKKVLQQKLATFRHPYDLSDIPYLESDHYKQLAKKTRARGVDDSKGYYKRDHDKIVWPPVAEDKLPGPFQF